MIAITANVHTAETCCAIMSRYVEEAEVDDEAEVTVNEIDDQVCHITCGHQVLCAPSYVQA